MHNQIKTILEKEQQRQDTTVELIASENYASQAVMDLCGSIFTNKYAEGYPGKRYYNGCEHMDEIEQLAIDKVCELYNCAFANVQPHSGVGANTAVYQALMEPGQVLMGMDLASGGHLSHGAKPTLSGKVYNAVTYGVDENGYLDYEMIRALAKVSQPKVIVAGASAYPRQINWGAFRDIADGIGAYLVVDMAHYSGLVAGHSYESPLPYADVVTSTTHKTLRGPRGGMMLWNNPDYTKKFNSSIFPGTQGGPLMNIIAAKAQCYIEANTDEFRDYSTQVVKNAQAMARQLELYGIEVLTGGTDSHIILIDLRDSKYSGRQAADLLEENG
ncbi:MAG TPA: serine hydroxymethyltransferase, partial [Flavobacteriales bacterium]|nr:serine hydroxymethyltransferase [Flavobacteriales bacterium]